MSIQLGPKLTTDNLSLYLDVANSRSFVNTSNGWVDLTGKRQNLSLSGATYNPNNAGVLTFDGNLGSSASIGENIFSPNSRTFDVWFKREQSVSQFNIVWGYYIPYLGFRPNGEFHFSYYTNDGILKQKNLFSGVTFSNNVWYNVTCTVEYDLVATTATAKMYVNGSLINTQAWPAGTMTQSLTSSANNYLIMGNWYSANPFPFKGSISNFRIYERILTDEEIYKNYLTLKSRFET
jgi:hypothetical protein